MAVYRTVHLSFWTDPKVDDEFTPEDKYFYLYLLTNPHTNICGCYELSEKQCSRETGYNTETISRLLDRFQKVHDVIRYDSKTKEVLILNWHKYNWTTSDKLMKSVSETAAYIKSEHFKAYIENLIEHPDDTVSIPYTYPMHTSDTVSVSITDSVTDNKRGIVKGGKKSFVPPTLEEVEDYCKERNSPVDPKQFWEYFDAGNWIDSKGQKVRSWKQKLITWEKGGYGSAGANNKPGSSERDRKSQEVARKYAGRDFYDA